ncbi:hypothetical protein [Corynebacterium mucifaciens]|uniref:Uncharacterized protein n=1 Tax=Corynebacterium mucifaciens TaxID=57171 RepID=A0A7X6LSC7_9CORY|nr:hypothetical protein [Corynebacterium mucifaciens]NKY68979.1 hypothetical protein [Corynebacterium mucifaciens]
MARTQKIVTAEDAKKKLGITSFRELSGEKVIELLNNMGGMDPETRKLIIAQFPSIRDFGNRAIDALDGAQSKVQDADSAEAHQVHQGWTEVRETLKEELKRDGLSESMRAFILEELIETADRQEQVLQKSRSARKEILEWAKVAVGGVITVGAVAATAALKERGK